MLINIIQIKLDQQASKCSFTRTLFNLKVEKFLNFGGPKSKYYLIFSLYDK